MRNTHLSTGLVVALTALLATGAMAQEGKGGGKGGGKRGDGQTVERDGKGSGKGNSGSSTTTPVTTAPTPSTPSWSGGRGNANTPAIDRNRTEQAAKIQWGQRRGLITDKEAKALKAEQDRIAHMERRAKADGNVTRDERRELRGAQREADRHIRDEAFDREREGRRYGRQADRGDWGRDWGGWGRGWW